MPIALFILVTLICASPAIALCDGLIVQAVVSGAAAAGLLVVAGTMRPGEIRFLTSIIRWLYPIGAIPALWILAQALPLGVFAHPIWESAELALGHRLIGSISIDPSSSVIELGQYLNLIAIILLCAAVSIDRRRAEALLFILCIASTLFACLSLAGRAVFFQPWLGGIAQVQFTDCIALGLIIISAACICAVERYESRQAGPRRSLQVLVWTLSACIFGFAICGVAVCLEAPTQVLIATTCGLVALACITIIRRRNLGLLGILGFALPLAGIAVIALLAVSPFEGARFPLAFATPTPASLLALNERVLEESPFLGSGAGTFSALATIYREMGDPPVTATAVTSAAEFVVELGWPMLCLIISAGVGGIVFLMHASLQRGRDSFYAAMGGSCLVALIALGFVDSGLLGTATNIFVAAIVGLALAQSKSRSLH